VPEGWRSRGCFPQDDIVMEHACVLECGNTLPLLLTRHVASNQSADVSAHSNRYGATGHHFAGRNAKGGNRFQVILDNDLSVKYR